MKRKSFNKSIEPGSFPSFTFEKAFWEKNCNRWKNENDFSSHNNKYFDKYAQS